MLSRCVGGDEVDSDGHVDSITRKVLTPLPGLAVLGLVVARQLAALDAQQAGHQRGAKGLLQRRVGGQGIERIAADCGGCLTCATCHVIVDAAWVERVATAQGEEDDMLGLTAVPRQPHSRLSCQIDLRAELDGLVVHLPERQY